MKLYKGYVKNNGKKPIEFVKGVKDFKTLDEVQRYPSYGGVLADNAILIDIDDAEQSEILAQIVSDFDLNCQIMQTSRGKHFTFFNCGVQTGGTNKKIACGLNADVKIGSKNAVECLKIDTNERFIERRFDEDNEATMPKWLIPITTQTDFFKLGEGEGRNSSLYKYILTLSAAGFSREESRETINIINKYILSSSLSDDEIETITRDDAFPKEAFYNGKSFLHNDFATFVKNENNVKRINGQLHVYKNGVYVPGAREIESIMVHHLPMLRAAQRMEVMKYLEIICPENQHMAEAEFIAFQNGIYYLVDDSLHEFSPEYTITNKIPWDYDPEAYSEIADQTLDRIACNDQNIRSLLEEAIGYSFFRRNEFSTSFFLTGEGSNGKSTFLDMVNRVVGDHNKSALGLEELEERFSVATLANKLINTGDDISEGFMQERTVSVFKKLVSGNEVKAEFKGQDAFFMKAYTKFFFSANSLPRTRSKGFEALKRRLTIIPFNAKFSQNDPDYDPLITWKLRDPEVMRYLVRIGIEGLKRVLKNKTFTSSPKVVQAVSEYEKENNPILLWLEEVDKNTIYNEPTKNVHRAYRMFCVENGFSEMTLSSFTRELSKRVNVTVQRKRINGALTSIYVKGDKKE